MRDRSAEFAAQGVAVLGVSFDAAAANAVFRRQHDLPSPLLCDTDRGMALAYGAAAADAAAASRIAVLIDSEGRITRGRAQRP